MTNPGHINACALLDECEEALWDIHEATMLEQAAAVINVLRRRGLINIQGVELCRSELGPLSVAVIKGDKDE